MHFHLYFAIASVTSYIIVIINQACNTLFLYISYESGGKNKKSSMDVVEIAYSVQIICLSIKADFEITVEILI